MDHLKYGSCAANPVGQGCGQTAKQGQPAQPRQTLEYLCDELGNVVEMAMQANCVAADIADRLGGAVPANSQGETVPGASGCLVERLATLIARLRATLIATHNAHDRASEHIG